MSSILNDVKKLLGIEEDYTYFDKDIVIHINSVFGILNQLGVGPDNGFAIEDATAEWIDFLQTTDPRLNMVKSYMYAKVRLLFDPPQTSNLKESLERECSELEWRINIQVDPKKTEE